MISNDVKTITIQFDIADTDETKTVAIDAESGQSLLDIALTHDIHLDHACGGNAACSTCHVKVKQGMDLLNDIDDIEEDLIDFAEDADLTSRLGCQCIPQPGKSGELRVEIPEQKGLH